MSYTFVRVICTIAVTLSLGLLNAEAQEETIGSGLRARGKSRELVALPKRRSVEKEVEEVEDVETPRLTSRSVEPRLLRSRTPQRTTKKSYDFGEIHRAAENRPAVKRVAHEEMIFEEGDYVADYDDGSYDQGCSSGACGPGGSASYGWDDWGCPSCLSLLFQRTEFFTGVQSFSGPANRGGAGSFGLHQGLNVGIPVFDECWGLGLQAGVQFTQSNFNGADFTDDDRAQTFSTFGMFRRVDWGLQWGLVVDYLHEDWYYQTDLLQLRGELSWMMPENTDIGFMFTSSLQDDQTDSAILTNGILNDVAESFETTDIFALFLRKSFCSGGEAKLFAGFSGQSDGILGGYFSMPLQNNVACRADLTYLIPEQGQLDGGHIEESWNMGFSLVFNSGCGPCGKNYYRPLFNVANNGSMLVDRR